MTFKPDTQQGASIAFTGLATFINAVTDIPAIEESGGVIEINNLGTTGQKKCIPTDLTDVSEFTVSFQHDGKTVLPNKNGVYTVTITGPIAPGNSSPENWAGSAIVTKVTSPQFSSGTPALQTMQVALKPDGGGSGGGTAWTRTAAA